MTINNKIAEIRKLLCFGDNKKFAEKLDCSVQYASNICKDGKNVGDKQKQHILDVFPQINRIWLLTGEGEMLKSGENQTIGGDGIKYAGGTDDQTETGKLIPFYDDVSTIGGVNERSANLEAASQPTDYIDTGDWFRDATAAIRHYGESMVEYPPGCILAIKEVYDRELIIPGRDYVIETSEYRVTKRIQRGKDSDHITAYSTNPETYADGRLIHEPFDIPWRAVMRISSVLGYVVKKNGGTMVFSSQKTK